jgi:hypothetical protein
MAWHAALAGAGWLADDGMAEGRWRMADGGWRLAAAAGVALVLAAPDAMPHWEALGQ